MKFQIINKAKYLLFIFILDYSEELKIITVGETQYDLSSNLMIKLYVILI